MVDAAPKRLPGSTPPCELYPVCQRALAGARAIYLLHPRPLLLISDARNIIDQVNKLKQDVCRSQ